MNLPVVKRTLITKEVYETFFVQKFLKNLECYDEYKNIQIEIVETYKDALNEYRNRYSDVHEAKDTILIYSHSGRFLHSCPGSDGMTCCNYFVINLGLNCSFDCSYCYLQDYLDIPLLTLFSNTDDLLEEVHEKLERNPSFQWRVGTGEYTDSLALDHLTQWSHELVPFFSGKQNASLELKTKSANVENLLMMPPSHNVVVSWSLTTEIISRKVERLTAPLGERLKAAKKVSEHGFHIGLHLDPIIWYEDWEEDYYLLIEEIFNSIPKESIRWVSMGTFRYSSGLKQTMLSRDANQPLVKAEMFPSDDGKFRYFAPQRAFMYRQIKKWIEEKDKEMFTYLCMESKQTWESVYGFVPENSKELEKGFAKRKELISC